MAPGDGTPTLNAVKPSTDEGQSLEAKTPRSSSSVGSYASAGAVASIFTKSLLHPIDTVKCRVQAHEYPNGLRQDFFPKWRGHWRPKDVYRGLLPKLIFYAPYQFSYMGAVQWTKELLSFSRYEAEAKNANASCEYRREMEQRRKLTVIASAIVAETSSSLIRVPMETYKLRLQASKTSSMRSITKEMMRSGVTTTPNGVVMLKNIYRNFTPQILLHDIPYSVIQWVTYDSLQQLNKQDYFAPAAVGQQQQHSDAKVEPVNRWFSMHSVLNFAAGSGAGFFTGAVTTPLDILKTRVIVRRGYLERFESAAVTGEQKVRAAELRATKSTTKQIIWHVYESELAGKGFRKGISVLFRGVGLRTTWMGANMGVYFFLFEGIKDRLG